MDEEVVFEGGQGLVREVEHINAALDKELTDIENQPKTFYVKSLHSDGENDDGSLENELQDLSDSQRVLQSELKQVMSSEEVESPVAQHVIEEALLHQIHDQLPAPDEYKVDRRLNNNASFSRGSDSFHDSFSRPGPPSMDPLVRDPEEALTKSERHARVSQLPSAEEMKSRPHVKPNPDDHLTVSDRHARISQLPPVKELQRKLRVQRLQERRHLIPTLMVCAIIALIVLAVVLPAVMLIDDKERFDDTVTALSKWRISKIEDLQTIGTPQHKAARWIANRDAMRVPISNTRTFLDRYVLAVIYYALGGDATWPHDMNFLSNEGVCMWSNQRANPLGNDLTVGVHGCKDVDGELVPAGIALGKLTTPAGMEYVDPSTLGSHQIILKQPFMDCMEASRKKFNSWTSYRP
jgi:hypothetical protein